MKTAARAPRRARDRFTRATTGTEGSPPPGDEPWSDTRVLKTMWPPQPGTKRLHEEFGLRLVCVRYRRDLTSGHRYTTVEILVDHAPVRRHDDARRMVEVVVHPRDAETQAHIKAHGGRWDPRTRNWTLTRKAALALGLKPKERTQANIKMEARRLRVEVEPGSD